MAEIRLARIEDAERLCLIDSEALGYDYPLDKTKKQLETLLSSPFYRFFVAVEDGKVIGYVHGADYDCLYADPLKNIMALAVLPEYQGLGIGRALLAAVEGWAKETGCAGVRLVSGMNRTHAHGFYAHCGYSLRKEQKNFIKCI